MTCYPCPRARVPEALMYGVDDAAAGTMSSMRARWSRGVLWGMLAM